MTKEEVKEEVIHLMEFNNNSNLYSDELFEIAYEASKSVDLDRLQKEEPLNIEGFYQVIVVSKILENGIK